MSNFAMYRLPYATDVFRIEDENPMMLFAATEFDDVSGFVFAPFVASAHEPIVVIQGEARRVELTEQMSPVNGKETFSKQSYAADFVRFHDAITDGRFDKLVLSRCSEVSAVNDIDAEALFAEACRRYPRMMIALVNIASIGTWLMATPEVLVTKRADVCQTMALAGTMPYQGEIDYEWSSKNKAEQAIVANYLFQSLKPLADDIEYTMPYTIRAGNLVHLRSDFSFRVATDASMGKVVEALHPTPAVCGMPKQEAVKFIIDNETDSRHYYSGYLGPWNIDGNTSLFVALRCMEIKGNRAVMHAGGGIMKESSLDSEWQETMIKMEAMRKLIVASPPAPLQESVE